MKYIKVIIGLVLIPHFPHRLLETPQSLAIFRRIPPYLTINPLQFISS